MTIDLLLQGDRQTDRHTHTHTHTHTPKPIAFLKVMLVFMAVTMNIFVFRNVIVWSGRKLCTLRHVL
jgi:hypothetical protein